MKPNRRYATVKRCVCENLVLSYSIQEDGNLTPNADNGSFDTLGALIVPSEDSRAIVQELRTADRR